MATKPFWNYLDAEEEGPLDRYIRIVYGTEYIVWKNGENRWYQTVMPEKLCTRDDIELTEEEFEQYGIASSYCPSLENVFITGQWSGKRPEYFYMEARSC